MARACHFDASFPRSWRAEAIERPPLIASARHFVYPKVVEEVEVGALQILVSDIPESTPFMATFALGFADPSLPHGVWSCPDPDQLCAVAGGYAYLVRTRHPEQWTQIPYRPVTALHPVPEHGLLIFASFHTLYAQGADGRVWETAKLSWEGVRVTHVGHGQLHGFGWDLHSDQEVPFAVDLRTGQHRGGSAPSAVDGGG